MSVDPKVFPQGERLGGGREWGGECGRRGRGMWEEGVGECGGVLKPIATDLHWIQYVSRS